MCWTWNGGLEVFHRGARLERLECERIWFVKPSERQFNALIPVADCSLELNEV